MSSSSADSDSGGEDSTINGDSNGTRQDGLPIEESEDGSHAEGERIRQLLEEERENPSTPPRINGVNVYKANRLADNASEDGSLDALPRGAQSPLESVMSIPDDSPSIQVRFRAQRFQTTQLIVFVGFHIIFSWRK